MQKTCNENVLGLTAALIDRKRYNVRLRNRTPRVLYIARIIRFYDKTGKSWNFEKKNRELMNLDHLSISINFFLNSDIEDLIFCQGFKGLA